MTRLDGRRALVTGGTGLIGGAVCLRLAAEGAEVAVGSRSPERSKRWIAENGGQWAGHLVPFALNLLEKDSIEAAIRELQESFGPPDVLVACASHRDALAKDLSTEPHEAFASLAAADLAGHFHLARLVVEKIGSDTPGSIVFLSSIYADNAVDTSIYPEGMERTPIHYSVTKAGVGAMVRELAARWGRSNIRVNAVVSGGVHSAERQPAEFVRRYTQKTMLGRMATPEEIAATVAFLASPDSSYVTAECLWVDGGFSSW